MNTRVERGIKIGQIWECVDPEYIGRKVEVLDIGTRYVVCRVVADRASANPPSVGGLTLIRPAKFAPRTDLYRLVLP